MRAVGGAHFAPPTHRTRCDGLVLDRSVPLSVQLDGDDYAWSADSGLESSNLGSGSLRFCQRRQPEQQRPQSHAAIKRGVGPRCSDVWPGVRSREPWLWGVTGASRKAHRRSMDGQRSDSKRGRNEDGGFAKRRLREAGSEAGAKAAALRARGNSLFLVLSTCVRQIEVALPGASSLPNAVLGSAGEFRRNFESQCRVQLFQIKVGREQFRNLYCEHLGKKKQFTVRSAAKLSLQFRHRFPAHVPTFDLELRRQNLLGPSVLDSETSDLGADYV